MRSILLASILAFSPAVLQAQTLSSRSDSAAQAIVINGMGGNGSGSGSGSGDGGVIRQRVETVPTAIAPGVYGANPCMVGGSGAVSVMGFGLGGGASMDGRECRDQEWFRFLHMAGEREVANAFACDASEAVRRAFIAMNRPCLPQDRPTVAPAASAPAPLAAPLVRASAQDVRPEWCHGNLSAAELRRNPECGR